jgi:hypothetical protein
MSLCLLNGILRVLFPSCWKFNLSKEKAKSFVTCTPTMLSWFMSLSTWFA